MATADIIIPKIENMKGMFLVRSWNSEIFRSICSAFDPP